MLKNDLLNKTNIIWDLDNTLYRMSPEQHEGYDDAMAIALIEDLGIKMDFETVKQMVKDSYKKYRDGGMVFYKEHGIDDVELYNAYHDRLPIELIKPYDNLLPQLSVLKQEQYIFTHAPHKAAKKTLEQIGLYEFFKDKIYSIEDFDYLKKNETPNVYYFLCEKIGVDPKDCIFVDDSYSNLKYPKQIGMTTVRLFYRENPEEEHYIDYAYNGAFAFLDALKNK